MRALILNFLMFLCAFNQIKCSDDKGLFSSLSNFNLRSFSKQESVQNEESSWSKFNPFGSKELAKNEESSWSMSNLNPFNSKDVKETKKTNESSWIPDYFMSSASERSMKRELPNNSSWFSNMNILNLISSKDLNGSTSLTSKDQAVESASSLNLTSYFSNWEMPNFNFSSNFTNLTNSLRMGIPKLDINNTSLFYKDWFISIKANQYGNLLSANMTNSTKSTNSEIILTTTTPSSVANSEDQTSYMNLTTFREKLIRVYDNLTYCEHPCNGM